MAAFEQARDGSDRADRSQRDFLFCIYFWRGGVVDSARMAYGFARKDCRLGLGQRSRKAPAYFTAAPPAQFDDCRFVGVPCRDSCAERRLSFRARKFGAAARTTDSRFFNGAR